MSWNGDLLAFGLCATEIEEAGGEGARQEMPNWTNTQSGGSVQLQGLEVQQVEKEMMCSM